MDSVWTWYLYKGDLSTTSNSQTLSSIMAKTESCLRTPGTRLYTCTRLGWASPQQASSLVRRDRLLEQLLENGTNSQSPSTWSSMQDVTSWGTNDLENSEETAQNYTGGTGQWPKESWDHSNNFTISNTLHGHGFKSCSTRNVPLLKPVHVLAHLKFARDQLDDSEEDCQMRPK